MYSYIHKLAIFFTEIENRNLFIHQLDEDVNDLCLNGLNWQKFYSVTIFHLQLVQSIIEPVVDPVSGYNFLSN